jgi:hypothetical protein
LTKNQGFNILALNLGVLHLLKQEGDKTMAPNQRDPEKKLVSFWINEGEKEYLAKKAKKIGKNLSDFIKEKLEEELSDYDADKK